MTAPSRIALFDLDHTLLSGDTDVLWCQFLIERRVLNRAEFAPRNQEMAERYAAGTVDAAEFANFYVSTLAGRSPKHWEPLREEFLATALIPRIPDAARSLVQRHQNAGDLVVMTTATNRFLTERTAEYFEIEHLIATDLQMTAGRFTGQTQGVLNMRAGKVERLHAWLAGRGLVLDQLASTAYSDSINDLPLLQAVNHPVAVDPDAALLAHAEATGWPVLRLQR
jgi:HAD superfamily hydrolase (TIGR01490 family)